ncbi:hypothetical protein Tco_0474872 [Tanacetum coccineum]
MAADRLIMMKQQIYDSFATVYLLYGSAGGRVITAAAGGHSYNENNRIILVPDGLVLVIYELILSSVNTGWSCVVSSGHLVLAGFMVPAGLLMVSSACLIRYCLVIAAGIIVESRSWILTTIDGIRTRKGWNFPSCGSDTLDVSDNTAQAVVVMFNETATAFVNCSADPLMDTVDEILPSEEIDDSVGSSNLDDYPDNQPQKMKRIVQDPSIVTLSKPVEERKMLRMDIEDSETKDSSDSANAKGEKGVVEPSAKKRKNRYIHSLGCTFTYVQLHVRLY